MPHNAERYRAIVFKTLFKLSDMKFDLNLFFISIIGHM